jgi:hypothetical protein
LSKIGLRGSAWKEIEREIRITVYMKEQYRYTSILHVYIWTKVIKLAGFIVNCRTTECVFDLYNSNMKSIRSFVYEMIYSQLTNVNVNTESVLNFYEGKKNPGNDLYFVGMNFKFLGTNF